jgi:hypothetical protein
MDHYFLTLINVGCPLCTIQRLKLNFDKLLSSLAFKFNLRRYIKGLLINFLHAHFPSLLKIPGFLVEFITPIIKASKGKKTEVFYTMPEYDNFKAGAYTRPLLSST